MNNRYAKKGDYKPVGNLAVDAVSACIDFYKRQPKRLKTIHLNHRYWGMFLRYIHDSDPTYIIPDSGIEIEGTNVIVRRGSGLQVEYMMFDFYSKEEVTKMAMA